MRLKSSLRKLISIALMIILLHKAGAGLFLHNWLHANPPIECNTAHSSSIQDGSGCNCIDDFYLAFLEAENPRFWTSPLPEINFLATAIPSISSSEKSYPALRGPPFIG